MTTEENYNEPSFELVLTRGRIKPVSTKCYSGEALAQWYEHQIQKQIDSVEIAEVDGRPKKKVKKGPKKHTIEAISNKNPKKKK